MNKPSCSSPPPLTSSSSHLLLLSPPSFTSICSHHLLLSPPPPLTSSSHLLLLLLLSLPLSLSHTAPKLRDLCVCTVSEAKRRAKPRSSKVSSSSNSHPSQFACVCVCGCGCVCVCVCVCVGRHLGKKKTHQRTKKDTKEKDTPPSATRCQAPLLEFARTHELRLSLPPLLELARGRAAETLPPHPACSHAHTCHAPLQPLGTPPPPPPRTLPRSSRMCPPRARRRLRRSCVCVCVCVPKSSALADM